MLYATGVRLRELTAIKIEDIVWSERSIFIPKGKGKKEQIVLFTRACDEILEEFLKDRSDDLPYLFVNKKKTGPACAITIQKKFERYRTFSAHRLRHTFAAHLAKKGMPLECIQVLLGHSTPQQSQRYSRLYDHARKEIYDQWM
jgi:integrase